MHESGPPANTPNIISKMSSCIKSIGIWMKENKLKLNDEKTELICVGSKNNLKQLSIKSMDINKDSIPFSDCVKNLGVFLDSSLSMDSHVNNLCKTLYFHLRRISKIRKYLTVDAANKLAVSFIMSRLDYCNSLLAGLSEKKISKLQRIQNCAARMVLRKSRRDSASGLLRSLHLLPVKARIEYKICCLCYQVLYTSNAPLYLKHILKLYTPSRLLRSRKSRQLFVPRYVLDNYGKRSFSIFGPKLWNSLPLHIKESKNVSIFKNKLKTHLFRKFLSEDSN